MHKIQNPKSRQKPTCASCRYLAREGDNGFCFRLPPSANLKPDGQTQGSRPPTKLDWWCGEWAKAT